MKLQVGDEVSVLDTEGSTVSKVGDIGTVMEITSYGLIKVYLSAHNLAQYFENYQVQPVSEVIKVDCRKPNVLKRICNYLRGIK